MLFASGASAAGTPAGTVISNIAHIGYRLAGAANAIDSNRVDIRVGEILDVSVTPAPICTAPATGSGIIAVGFRITNLGNGNEAFIPGTPTMTDGGTFMPTGVVVDSNGNGCYDPGVDRLVPPGGMTPVLAPGQSIIIFVIGTGGNGIGRVRIVIRPATGAGTGVPGTAVLGGGDGGGDAVIRYPDGGVSDVPTPSMGTLVASLVKSQTVRAPDGSAEPRRDAVITYRIEGSFTGTGTATDVAVADAIPAGTSYIAGSLELDGAAVSDAADRDAGDFDGARVSVALGNVPAPAVHTVSFQVRIN